MTAGAVRLGNLSGRAALLDDDRALDVERASEGRFPSDVQRLYETWRPFLEWADRQDVAQGEPYERARLEAPVPRPRQIFAIGLNYAEHAAESGFSVPAHPSVFTKFASAIAGADVEIELPGPRIDWEAELVVVIAEGGRDIGRHDAWSRIAGLAVGQDLSDRTVQFWGSPAQFSLGKSRKGFAPIGPWVIPADRLDGADRDDLRIVCSVTDASGGQRVLQDGRTRDMIRDIPTIVEELSSVIELLPGDVVFTGTPEGVGIGRDPQVFLERGDVLVTEIEGIGSIRQRFV